MAPQIKISIKTCSYHSFPYLDFTLNQHPNLSNRRSRKTFTQMRNKKKRLFLRQTSIFHMKLFLVVLQHRKKLGLLSNLQCGAFLGIYNIKFATIKMNTVVDKHKLLNWVKNTGINEEFEAYYYKLSIPKDLKLKKMNETIIQGLCSKANGENKKSTKTVLTTNIPNDFVWRIGEYKLYIWVCSLYMFIHKISAHHMTQNDFVFLNKIFIQKNTILLRYQLLCVFPSKASLKKQWDQVEIDYLKDIINKKNNNDEQISWKQVSYELYLNSDKQYFRTNAKCRQMWNNHLRPNLTKNKWTTAEDLLLFSALEEESRCWSRIAKHFQGTRNQHMIKNRYKKLMNINRYKKQELSRRQKQKNIAKLLFFRLKKEKNQPTQSTHSAFQSESECTTKTKKKKQQSELPPSHKILPQIAVSEEQLTDNKIDNNFMAVLDYNCFFNYTFEDGEIKFEDVLKERPRLLFDQGLVKMLDEGHVQFIEESFYETQKFEFEHLL